MTNTDPEDTLGVVASERRRLGNFWLGVVTAVSVGAIVRFAVLVDKWDQPLLLNDSLYYSGQAQQLARGQFFREVFVDQPGAEHGPLTSMLMAPLSWMETSTPWQRLVTVVCGIATIVVIGLLGRAVAGPRVGVVAAALAAVYPNLWMNDGLVMSESVSVLAVSLVLLATHRRVRRPTVTDEARRVDVGLLGLGMLAGLAVLARSELALLVPIIAVLLWRSARRHLGSGADWRRAALPPLAVLVGVGTVVAPWVVFNLIRFERPVLLTTNDGTTLLGAYCDPVFGDELLGGWSVLCVLDDPAYSKFEEPSVRSARQRAMAVAYARAHVDDLPRVVAARIGRTLDLYGLDSLVEQDVGEERYRWASWSGIVAWWGLALVGGLAVWSSRRTMPSSTRWLLASPCAVVAVSTIVFYGAHRIRSSMEPTVVVFAAIGIVTSVEGWSTRRRRTLPPASGGRDGARRAALLP